MFKVRTKFGRLTIEGGLARRPAPKKIGGEYYHGTSIAYSNSPLTVEQCVKALRYVGATRREIQMVMDYFVNGPISDSPREVII